MKTYDVYRHPQRDEYEAVKRGFSWPALIFSSIWAIVKGLWAQAAGFIAATITIGFVESVFQESGLPPGNPVPAILLLALHIWFGRSGNQWRRRSLVRKKYTHVEKVQATTGFDAIEMVTTAGESGNET